MTSALQALYVAMGVGFNLLSVVHHRRTGHTHTPVNPWVGLVIMALYAGVSTLHVMGIRAGTAGLVIMLVLIVYGGILRHLHPASSNQYTSTAMRRTALAINGFGALITIVALTSQGTP